jgi:hypothetical protein
MGAGGRVHDNEVKQTALTRGHTIGVQLLDNLVVEELFHGTPASNLA